MYAKHAKEEIGNLLTNSFVFIEQIQIKKEPNMERKQIEIDHQELKPTEANSKLPLRN